MGKWEAQKKREGEEEDEKKNEHTYQIKGVVIRWTDRLLREEIPLRLRSCRSS